MPVTNENWKPTIVAFCCNWCSYAGADLAGSSRLAYPADVKIIRVPCSCRVNPMFIMLDYLGVEDGRTRVEWVSAAEGAKFSETMNSFVSAVRALGPSVRLGDMRCRN